MIFKAFDKDLMHFFRTIAGNLSGPEAELVGISLIAFSKSSIVNSMSVIGQVFLSLISMLILVFSEGLLKTLRY